MSHAAIRAALKSELGADVPPDTLSRWVREARLSTPIDRQAVLRDAADRAACLISAEVSRLERQTAKTRDLGRLDQIARTLKTLQSIEPSKAGTGRQTLADLSEAPQIAGKRGVPTSRDGQQRAA